MLPAIRLREHEEQVPLRDVADQHHVEDPVVGLGIGAHHHAAPEVAAVRDDDVDHPPAADLVVDRHAELVRLPADEHRQRRPVVRHLPAERLGRLVRASGDRAADPRARDVREVRATLGARPGPEGHEPQVDRAHVLREHRRDGVLQPARDPVRADEVPPGAVGKHSEVEPLEVGDAVHDLVDGAVASDDDEQCRAALHGFPRERGEVPLLLGEERVAVEPERRAAVRDLRPAAAGAASGGGGVDEEDRPAANGRRSPCRARSASSGRRPRGARRRRS